MASDSSFVAFVLEQMASAGAITSRKMFGEHAVYCDGKVVALVCDDQLFVKPTPAGRALAAEAGETAEAPAYPGAKPSLLIQEHLEDAEWLARLVRATADALPTPKPRRRKPKTGGAARGSA